jgi:signal transduction histidine kinase
VRGALRTLGAASDRDKMLSYLSQQLVRQEKLATLGRHVAGLFHDVSNPLTIALGESDALNETLSKNELPADATTAVQQSLKNLAHSLERIESLTQAMRAFVYPGRGRQEHFNVNEGLDHLLRLMACRLKPEIEVIKEYGQIPSIVCSAHELMQVFGNLISNAIDAMNGRGELRVRTRGDAEWVRIEICDTGVGMDPETLGNLFRPFFTTKSMEEGTGLGLALARQVVEHHRGTIQVESTLGQGSRFTIVLAVAGPSGARA